MVDTGLTVFCGCATKGVSIAVFSGGGADKARMLNEYYYKKGVRWMPVEYYGSIIRVGPIISSEAPGCFECLVKMGLPHKSSRHGKYGPDTSEKGLISALCSEYIRRFCKNDNDRKRYVMEFKSGNTTKISTHLFVPYFNCPVCGSSASASNKITIKARAIDYFVQGYRCISAIRSLKKISPIISKYGPIKELGNSEDLLIGTDFDKRRLGDFGFFTYYAQIDGDNYSAGKGTSVEQAKMSAIAEAVERLSGRKNKPDRTLWRAYAGMREPAIDPNRFLFLKRGSVEYNKQKSSVIEWTKAYSLTNKAESWIPADLVYIPLRSELMRRSKPSVFPVTTNGLAAGNCIEEAILQGIFELIERDAVYIARNSGRTYPSIELENIGDDNLRVAVKHMLEMSGCELLLRDLTTDVGIPAVFALLIDRRTGEPTFCEGSGAHIDPSVAISRAITECMQIKTNQRLMMIGGGHPTEKEALQCIRNNLLVPGKEPEAALYFNPGRLLYKNIISCCGRSSLKSCVPAGTNDIKAVIEHVLDILRKCNVEVFVCNRSLPHMGLDVVRIIAAGLQPASYKIVSKDRISSSAAYNA